MEQSFEEKLLNIIKKDDLKAFNALTEETKLGNLRMGRFPVLSLLYLFGARRIISAYEIPYLKISTWEELAEPASVAELFAKKAGKCLRLYLDEVVSPVEMLLVLDKTRRVKKAYPVAKPSEAIRKRLKAIYNIKYALGVTYRGNNIVLDRRPLNRREKKRLALACIGCLLILAIVIAAPVTAAQLLPNRAAGEVTKLKHIDFSSRKTYTVVKDIVIPDGYTVDIVTCNIRGGGGRLIFGKGATLGEFSGTLSDIEISTKGSPIFEMNAPSAVIKNVTVNVEADVEATEESGFVVIKNYGTIDNVRVNAKGRVRAPDEPVQETDDEGELVTPSAIFGGIAGGNLYGEIKDTFPVQRVWGVMRNCSVNFSDLELAGKTEVDSSFGGLAGRNTSIIEDCVVSGNITADTFDVGGACCSNFNAISRVINKADITQISQDEKWSSVVAGVVIRNEGSAQFRLGGAIAQYCKNEGNIFVQSVGTAISGGIVADSYGAVENCLFDGDIRAEAYSACVGGIVASAYGKVDTCLSDGDIGVTANYAYVGGIVGRVETASAYSAGSAEHCAARGTITVELSDEESCVGGIVGLVVTAIVARYTYDQNGNPIKDEKGEPIVDSYFYFGGRVKNCVYCGERQGTDKYFGNIVGVTLTELYDSNACFPGGGANFEGNAYVQNGAISLGAKAITEGEEGSQTTRFELPTEDKGAQAMSKESVLELQLLKDILAAFAEEQ